MITLRSRRLELRPTEYEDIDQQLIWLSDKDLLKYSEQRHWIHSHTTQYEYIKSLRNPFNDNILLSICLEGKMIGTISAIVDTPNKTANIGILIGEKSKHNNGFGLEAWKSLCDYLLDNGTRKVDAGCMAINTGMVHICTRYLMAQEAIIPKHFLVNDKPVDLLLWSKFK